MVLAHRFFVKACDSLKYDVSSDKEIALSTFDSFINNRFIEDQLTVGRESGLLHKRTIHA
jgi:hypothetical protein